MENEDRRRREKEDEIRRTRRESSSSYRGPQGEVGGGEEQQHPMTRGAMVSPSSQHPSNMLSSPFEGSASQGEKKAALLVIYLRYVRVT